MAKIVNIKEYRTRSFEKRSFGPWQRRFGEPFHHRTRIADLSDRTLYRLATPGDDTATLFYELIMGILDLGQADEFRYLDDEDKIRVVEIHLYMADHVRFEMMRRLKWIIRYPCQRYTLVEMATRIEEINADCRTKAPELAPSHRSHGKYEQLIIREKQVFIRKMLNDALTAFRHRMKR